MLLDHEKYANVTQPAGQSGYRKQLNLMTGEISMLMCELKVLLLQLLGYSKQSKKNRSRVSNAIYLITNEPKTNSHEMRFDFTF